MDFNKLKPSIKVTLILIGTILFVYIYKNFSPNQYLFPKCPVHSFTGLYCPGCGSQRAIHSFLNLNFKDVFSYNPLVGIILSAIVIDILLFTLNIKRFRLYTFLKTNRYSSLIVLYTVILFTIFRNIPVFPFTLLAP